MKSGFTIVKAASVMLAAIMLGTGCQKQLETKDETRTASASASQSAREKIRIPLYNRYGKEVGSMTASDFRDYTRVEVSVSSTLARNATGISALMVTDATDKYAIMNEFGYYSESSLTEGNYVSVTSPITDMGGKTPTYQEFIKISPGYSMLVMDASGNIVARGAIK